MILSRNISDNSDEFQQTSSNYMKQVESWSSFWSGSSHDNLFKLGSLLHIDMKKITEQINAFAEAISLYDVYKEFKEKCEYYMSLLSQLGDDEESQSLASYYWGLINECQKQMAIYSERIEQALSIVKKLPFDGGNKYNVPVSYDEENEGEFVHDRDWGVYGHFMSSLDGTTHTVFNQMQIWGWWKNCNRASAASIASGFETDSAKALELAKAAPDGIGYNSEVTNDYFSNFGMSAKVNRIDGQYDTVKDDIITNLNEGNYIMFDLSEKSIGKSNQLWTNERHWLSILDIKKIGDGPNDYAIFVSDSAHKGSIRDRGLGAGWYTIDEFDGLNIANLTVVSKND